MISNKYIHHKHLDITHALLESVFNTMGEAIIVADESGKIIMTNQHVHTIWGYKQEYLLGEELIKLMPEKFHSAHSDGMQRYVSTNEEKVLYQRLELEGLHADGHTFPIQLFISETIINNVRFFTAAVRDITDMVNQREELERTKELLLKNFQYAELENAKLMQEIKLDPMTRLFNHRSFIDNLKKELCSISRTDSELSLLFFDIDNFKVLNDRYGHQCGDEYLLELSSLLSDKISRSNDIISRYGGEEFAIILPGTSVEGALHVAEQLRIDVEQHQWPKEAITVTVGVATTDIKINFNQLIHQADMALYHGKKSGKNQVVHWNDIEKS